MGIRSRTRRSTVSPPPATETAARHPEAARLGPGLGGILTATRARASPFRRGPLWRRHRCRRSDDRRSSRLPIRAAGSVNVLASMR